MGDQVGAPPAVDIELPVLQGLQEPLLYRIEEVPERRRRPRASSRIAEIALLQADVHSTDQLSIHLVVRTDPVAELRGGKRQRVTAHSK